MSVVLNLAIHLGDRLIERRTFDQPVVKLGKLKSSHLCLPHDDIARMHAVVEVTGSDLRLVDLGSTCGVSINGQRVVKSAALRSGDVLGVGPYSIHVEATQTRKVATPRREADETIRDSVLEVIAVYRDTVLDVQHLGQAQSRPRRALPLLATGALLCGVGAAAFAYSVANASAAPQGENASLSASSPAPAPPDLGGLALALGLLGLVPLVAGFVRAQDRDLEDYVIGEGPDVTFATPAHGLPSPDAFPLVHRDPDGSGRLRFSAAMDGDVTVDGQPVTLHELARRGWAESHEDSSYTWRLPTGARATVHHAGVTFRVHDVPRAAAFTARHNVDQPFVAANLASLVTLGALLTLIHFIPETGLDYGAHDPALGNRFVGYMHRPDHAKPEPAPTATGNDLGREGGEPGQRHAGHEGAMGDPREKARAGRMAIAGPKDATPRLARDFDPDRLAREAGILGEIQSRGYMIASAFGGDFAIGRDDADVWGQLRGSEIGSAHGLAGLGTIGTGRGGGGDAEGLVGLGDVGLIGRNIGTGEGRITRPGAEFGDRRVRRPVVRESVGVVRGALDRDVIRRVVRAHINEVRHCYNQGLVRDPNLRGRVAIQFSIGGLGTVLAASVQESSITDPEVGRCIAQAVRRWKFPRPEGGGAVLVTYPFALSPG